MSLQAIRLGLSRLYDTCCDLRYGVATTAELPSDTPSRHADNVMHIATSYRRLDNVFRHLSIAPDDVFVDFGCGLGRAACVAARYPLKAVYGVEISPDLAARATENAAKLRGGVAGKVEIVCCSAEDFDCRVGSVFYLFNPFGAKTLAAVLGNIRAAAELKPVRVVYQNPEHREVLDNAGWLSPAETLRADRHGQPITLLYRSR